MNRFSVLAEDDEDFIGDPQNKHNKYADYMELKSEELDAKKKKGEWFLPIEQGSFTMSKKEFLSKFGKNSSYDEIIYQIPKDRFTLVDLLKAIYKDSDKSSTTWRSSRQLLHPKDIDGMEILYLSNRAGIWSIDSSDPSNPIFISLMDIIDHFEQSEDQ